MDAVSCQHAIDKQVKKLQNLGEHNAGVERTTPRTTSADFQAVFASKVGGK
jgi:hypothetical protein